MQQLKIVSKFTSRDTLSMELYLVEISKISLLTVEEEIELAAQAQKGSKEAKKKLVLANLRFVVSVAKQYRNLGLSMEDLINEGNIGLLKAVDYFDVTKGFKFISYAVWWIRQSILQALADFPRLIRLPLSKLNVINKINRYVEYYEQLLERPPTYEEIAEELNLKEKEIKEAIGHMLHPIYLDHISSEKEESFEKIVELLISRQTEDNRQLFSSPSFLLELERSLEQLPEPERKVLIWYYGLYGEFPHTFESIGQKISRSCERVRQIYCDAIRHMKEESVKKRLREFL